MSDPVDPDRPVPNPPEARRTRGPRAAARQAARQAEREAAQARAAAQAAAQAAAAQAGAAPAPTKGKTAALAKPAEEEEKDRSPARGMVCPRCGKYHDISQRPIGSSFECKCGAQLRVPPIRDTGPALPAPLVLRLRDLHRRRNLAIAGMMLAFPICIALISASLYLLTTERSYVTGTCAGLTAIGFLSTAVIATNEYRRTSAELAAEEPGD